jgi:heterodisulfide reductase subunit D
MSKGVKVLSRLQLPTDLIASMTGSARADTGPTPDVVMYLGCNVLKTPHIALLCLDVLDRLGTRYKVFGGPANCCGVIQYRAGDAKAAGRIGGNTVDGFAGTGASSVLTWCPTCNIQLNEIVMPGRRLASPSSMSSLTSPHGSSCSAPTSFVLSTSGLLFTSIRAWPA